MLPQELDLLIDQAVADGEITSNDRAEMYNKALELGVNMDEFEMTLEARLYKAKQNLGLLPGENTRKYGYMSKCPSCGTPTGGFTTTCSQCGCVFRNEKAVSSANRLFEQLQQLEKEKSRELALHNEKKTEKLNQLSSLHNNGRGLDNRIIDKEEQKKERNDLLAQMEVNAKLIEKKYLEAKIEAIKTFDIPEAKEDLLELLSMASSHAYDNDHAVGPEEEAWLRKTDRVYQKLLIAAETDPAMVDQANSMIVSLMKRLPKPYKNFTNIPRYQKDLLIAELAAEKEARRTERIFQIKQICMGWMGITLFLSVLCIILGAWIETGIIMLIGMVGLVAMIWLVSRKIKSKGDDRLYD